MVKWLVPLEGLSEEEEKGAHIRPVDQMLGGTRANPEGFLLSLRKGSTVPAAGHAESSPKMPWSGLPFVCFTKHRDLIYRCPR